MAVKPKNYDDMTDEDFKEVGRQLYEQQCAEAYETEDPPVYDDGDTAISRRILSDLGDSEEDDLWTTTTYEEIDEEEDRG